MKILLKSNIVNIYLLHVLINHVLSDLQFHNLNDKLVLQLIKASKPRTNVVGSSLLLRFPLCKLASIAEGDAKQELMTALGLRNQSMIYGCYPNFEEHIVKMTFDALTLANKIYVKYTDDIDPKFIANATKRYGVQVEKVGFNYPNASVTFINNVISKLTLNRVNHIVDMEDVNKNTSMIIVTAAHFKPMMDMPFDIRLTRYEDFHHDDGRKSKVPMMSRGRQYHYHGDSDCEVILMSDLHGQTIHVILMPGQNGISDLIEKMINDPLYVDKLLQKTKVATLRFKMPKFKINTYIDWTGFLQEFGVTTIFSNESGLSAILKEDNRTYNFALHKVKQRIVYDMTEAGVIRNADVADTIGMNIPLTESIRTVTADKPFIFIVFIQLFDDPTLYELFKGVYYGPEDDDKI